MSEFLSGLETLAVYTMFVLITHTWGTSHIPRLSKMKFMREIIFFMSFSTFWISVIITGWLWHKVPVEVFNLPELSFENIIILKILAFNFFPFPKSHPDLIKDEDVNNWNKGLDELKEVLFPRRK